MELNWHLQVHASILLLGLLPFEMALFAWMLQGEQASNERKFANTVHRKAKKIQTRQVDIEWMIITESAIK